MERKRLFLGGEVHLMKFIIRKYDAFPLSALSVPHKTRCGDRVSVQDWTRGSMKRLKVELPSRN